MKTRYYARDLMGTDELSRRRNNNSLDWTDKDSIIKAIDEYLAENKEQEQPEQEYKHEIQKVEAAIDKLQNDTNGKLSDKKRNDLIDYIQKNIDILLENSKIVFRKWLKDN